MLGKTNSIEKINNQDLLVKQNGIYKADEAHTGLGTVTVDVPEAPLLPSTYTIEPDKEDFTSSTPQYTDHNAPYVDEYGTSYAGVDKIKVRKVGSWVDNNISSSNIKKGVSILGVEGTLEGEKVNIQPPVTVDSSTQDQTITPDVNYDALSEVKINKVTSAIDASIIPENIKLGKNILGVDGTFEGEKVNIQPPVTVEPETVEQTITPEPTFDALSKVIVNKVTSAIDTNILAENIKKGISILGVAGSLEEGQKLNLQTEKRVKPSKVAVNVTPDLTYDALLKVIVEAVDASVDSNIVPENIKKNVSILGVMGALEGGKSNWFNFEGLEGFPKLSSNVLGGNGAIGSNKVLTTNNEVITLPKIDGTTLPIKDIQAVLFTTVFGYDDEEVQNPIIMQPMIYFVGGYYYDQNNNFISIPDRVSYLYPMDNPLDIDGCLYNYDDNGAEKTLALYVLKTNPPKPVLVDEAALSEPLSNAIRVKDMIIPAHESFEAKMQTGLTSMNFEPYWVLKDRVGLTSTTVETNEKPLTVKTSAIDFMAGQPDIYLTESRYIQSGQIKEYGTKKEQGGLNFYSGFSASTYFSAYTSNFNATHYDIIQKASYTGNTDINALFGTTYSWYVGVENKKPIIYMSGATASKNELENGLYWFRYVNDNSKARLYTYKEASYNFNTVGDPYIYDYWMFSDNTNYAYLPLKFKNLNDWEICISTSFSTFGTIFGDKDNIYKSPLLEILADGKMQLSLSSNGTAFDIADAVQSTKIFNRDDANIKLKYDGVKYSVIVQTTDPGGMKLDETVIEVPSSTPIFNDETSMFAFCYASGKNAWGNPVRINKSYIKDGAEMLWQPTIYFNKGIDNLPSLSAWTLEVEISNSERINNYEIHFGQEPNTNHYWHGVLNMGGTRVSSNDTKELLWQPYEVSSCDKVTSHQILPNWEGTFAPYKRTISVKESRYPFVQDNPNFIYGWETDDPTKNDIMVLDKGLKALTPNKNLVKDRYFVAYYPIMSPKRKTCSITCYTSSEANCDYGAIFLGTAKVKPSLDEIRNKTERVDGTWIYSDSGDNTPSTHTFTIEANTQYYLTVLYAKDGSNDSYNDNIIITQLSLPKEVFVGNVYNYVDDGSATDVFVSFGATINYEMFIVYSKEQLTPETVIEPDVQIMVPSFAQIHIPAHAINWSYNEDLDKWERI